jgi:dihydropteroate synthase
MPPERRHAKSLRLSDGRAIRFPAMMGVLNVTPDSFSDGGRYLDPDEAVEHAIEMAESGAQIIDVGGESTRPGAREISVGEELRRVMPVIQRLAPRLRIPLSIDTRKAAVARAAVDEGVTIVNDVSAMEFDPAMAETVARARASIVLMHMRGTPQTMMRLARYRDVVGEVRSYLAARIKAAIRSEISPARVIIDPGLGFAKTARHSFALLDALPRLCGLGYPILVGASRKSFVRKVAGAGETELAFGTAAAVALAIARGASIVRVHDPAAMAAAVKIAAATIAASRHGTGRSLW